MLREQQERSRIMLTNAKRMQITQLQAEKRHEHARRCKKPLDECIVCKDNIRWFAELPPAVLSAMLEEKRTV